MAKYNVFIPSFDGALNAVVVPQAGKAEVNDLGHLIFIDGSNAVAVFRDWTYAQEVPSGE